MKLKLDKSTKSSDVKATFMDNYEGLKIEFFGHSHVQEEGSPKKDMIEGGALLGDLNPSFEAQEVEIDGEMSVNQVEDYFESNLGFHIQVFRKMNISWIETTATDKYTLNDQMRLSRESRGLS